MENKEYIIIDNIALQKRIEELEQAAIKLARKTTMKVFKDSDDEEGVEYNVCKYTTEQIIDKIKMREDD